MSVLYDVDSGIEAMEACTRTCTGHSRTTMLRRRMALRGTGRAGVNVSSRVVRHDTLSLVWNPVEVAKHREIGG